MNRFVRVDKAVKKLVSYGAMCACLFATQKAGAQTPNLLIAQPFNANAVSSPYPSGWSYNVAPNTSGGTTDAGGWRFSVASHYLESGVTGAASFTTYNNGNITITPRIQNGKRLSLRYAKQSTDNTSVASITVEYVRSDSVNGVGTLLGTIANSDFASTNSTNFTTSSPGWKVFSVDLSGITGSYKIRFTDVRAATYSANTAYARYIDSLNVIGIVSIDTATFKTTGTGNFSSSSNWSYFDGENYQPAPAGYIPSSTNNLIITTAFTLDTSYTTGDGKTVTANTAGAALTIAPNKTFATAGSGTANFGSQPVLIQSNATGTGKIGQSGSGSITATNLTVERYIPAKATRKFSFMSSPFGAQTVRNGWQSQIFITGSGTGGTPCGSTTGNGGTTDLYNSNGFDDTQNDPSSMDYYANTVGSNGSRWTQISNTGITLTPGLGYRVNVRGNRADANACATQLAYTGAVPATTAVTVRSNGTYNSVASVAINTATATANTLLGNPYPCELSFTAFQASNTGAIANKAWLYASNAANTSDLYSAWNAGQVTNAQYLPAANLVGSGPTTYDNIIISSGTAFFVERANGGTSVNFAETHKSSVLASGNGVLSKTTLIPWTDFVNAHLQTQADTATDLDNIIVRFSDEAGVSNTTYGALDGYSFNSSLSSIASVKAGSRMAIQTRVRTVSPDTVALYVGYTPGSYRLKFDQFQNFTNLSSIYLLDNFLNTATNVTTTGAYNFDITSNSLSQGGNRFALAFGFTSNPLGMKFISVGAKALAAGASVNFSVGNEADVQSYSVERSDDAATFYNAATIKGSKAGSYTVTDNKELKSATTLYRVKATDLNGNVAYSSIVKLNQGAGATKMNLYPTPVTAGLNISLTGTISGNYSLNIVNMEGAVVLTQSGAAQQYLSLPTDKLTSGIYIVKMTLDNGDVIVEKFVKK